MDHQSWLVLRLILGKKLENERTRRNVSMWIMGSRAASSRLLALAVVESWYQDLDVCIPAGLLLRVFHRSRLGFGFALHAHRRNSMGATWSPPWSAFAASTTVQTECRVWQALGMSAVPCSPQEPLAWSALAASAAVLVGFFVLFSSGWLIVSYWFVSFFFFLGDWLYPVEAATLGGTAEVIALKPSVEACNRSWPHDRVEVWERCFVAFDFNRDDGCIEVGDSQ